MLNYHTGLKRPHRLPSVSASEFNEKLSTNTAREDVSGSSNGPIIREMGIGIGQQVVLTSQEPSLILYLYNCRRFLHFLQKSVYWCEGLSAIKCNLVPLSQHVGSFHCALLWWGCLL